MDRIKIDCVISSQPAELQLDKKALPDEPGPTFMLLVNGCFNGYITKQKDGLYKALGGVSLSEKELLVISQQINKLADS